MDLLNKNRLLIHTGNLLQLDPNHKISECFALLFDNYCGAFNFQPAFLTEKLSNSCIYKTKGGE